MRYPAFLCAILWMVARGALADPTDLTQLSIEELMEVQIVTASKKAQSLRDVPASVYVITADDIHRMGATSIPDVYQESPSALLMPASGRWRCEASMVVTPTNCWC